MYDIIKTVILTHSLQVARQTMEFDVMEDILTVYKIDANFVYGI